MDGDDVTNAKHAFYRVLDAINDANRAIDNFNSAVMELDEADISPLDEIDLPIEPSWPDES